MRSVWFIFCDRGFHSVCPLRDKDKRFMEASWWKRLTVRKTGSCSDGPTKVLLVKAMVFPVVMCGCESWTRKQAEHQIHAFELWCWRRLLRAPWTARRSNQSILKEISPEYSLEGLMLSWNSNTLATWCKELTHWKRPWCWERLKAGGEGDDRGWDGWMASLTQWTWVWTDSGNWWRTWEPGVLQSMGSQRVRHDWVAELNWTEDWKRQPGFLHNLKSEGNH